MTRAANVALSVVVGALVAAGVYVWLWASPVMVAGLFVTYAVGTWAFVDAYGDWPEPDGPNWLQALFPVFAMTAALFGVPASLSTSHRFALVVLVFGAAYGGIFLGMAWMLRATWNDDVSDGDGAADSTVDDEGASETTPVDQSAVDPASNGQDA
jgi:asparagine N-glycosylation enzyme membrane subunit Stt3